MPLGLAPLVRVPAICRPAMGRMQPEEILEYWGRNAGSITWMLTPSEARKALALRSDFHTDKINALRL